VNAEFWGRIKTLFDDVLSQSPDQRTALLDRACRQEPELAEPVRRLLALHDEAGTFLERPFLPNLGMDGDRSFFSDGQIVADRFRVLRLIAKGGIGEVYEAEDLLVGGEHIALKTLRPEISHAPETVFRLVREMQLGRKVTHQNVCRVYDVVSHRSPSGDRTTVITMELLPGETLSDRLRRKGRFQTAEAFPLVVQMAEALQCAHENGVIHRDFKSSNVVLVEQSNGTTRSVVTDFGLARLIEESRSRTGRFDSGLVGTPAYMAPEQVEGGETTFSTDVYALGVVTYEMITGRLPFEAESPLAIALKRLKEPPTAPRTLVPDLDPTWERAILRCLERSPENRFSSTQEFPVALRGDPTSLPTLTVVARPERSRLARRLPVWAALFVTMLVALFLLRFLERPASMQGSHEPIAVLPFENLSPDPAYDYFSDGITDEIILALTKVGELKVVARASSFQFKGKTSDIDRIRSQLKARTLLTGSVRKERDRLRVTAQLVSAESGIQLWSQSFDGVPGDVFNVQAKISSSIVSRVATLASPIRTV